MQAHRENQQSNILIAAAILEALSCVPSALAGYALLILRQQQVRLMSPPPRAH
jgi:hypothetical protein